MKIFIVGFSCSGKTTLAKSLAKSLNMKFISIDRFRYKYNQYCSLEGEILAYNMFISACNDYSDKIIECTSYSKHYSELFNDDWQVAIIHLKCGIETVLKRNEKRNTSKNFKVVPFPYKTDLKDSYINLMQKIDNRYSHLEIDTDKYNAYQTYQIAMSYLTSQIDEWIYQDILNSQNLNYLNYYVEKI